MSKVLTNLGVELNGRKVYAGDVHLAYGSEDICIITHYDEKNNKLHSILVQRDGTYPDQGSLEGYSTDVYIGNLSEGLIKLREYLNE